MQISWSNEIEQSYWLRSISSTQWALNDGPRLKKMAMCVVTEKKKANNKHPI